MHDVFNERVKLTAAWMNQLATAIAAAGVFAPLVALVFGFHPFQGPSGLVISLTINCGALSAALHFYGRWLLGRLKS